MADIGLVVGRVGYYSKNTSISNFIDRSGFNNFNPGRYKCLNDGSFAVQRSVFYDIGNFCINDLVAATEFYRRFIHLSRKHVASNERATCLHWAMETLDDLAWMAKIEGRRKAWLTKYKLFIQQNELENEKNQVMPFDWILPKSPGRVYTKNWLEGYLNP